MSYIREEFEEQMFDKILAHRFKDIQELQEKIDDVQFWVDGEDVLQHSKIEIEDISDYHDYLHDYNLCCVFETNSFYCDLDIYYLIDRQGNLYITEIGYTYE